MSNTQTPVDSHLMLVQNLAHVVAQGLPWQSAYDAVESSTRALAAIPAQAETCPICFSDEPYTGSCGSNDPRALCKRAPTQPTAPAQDAQGVVTYYFQRFVGGKRMAEDVEVSKASTLEDAVNIAARICPARPMTVLVLAALRASSPADTREPLTDKQIEALRDATFSINNPFCPVDSKSMRKAVRAAERAHGIVTKERA